MTECRLDTLRLPAAELGPENPLPHFRSPADHLPPPLAMDLPAEEAANYGRFQAERVLPHRLQDLFNRRKRERDVPSVVLENDFLKAIFVPAWGGRLWSLFYKPEQRELLHRNPVFQPANLALRQAWISGGIEWNMGRCGHHDYTVSPVFAARLRGPGGAPVLRLYEWERVGRFPWQIDFMLPADSHFLWARMRLVNPHDTELPNYWWTNMAVEEKPDARVLAPTDAYLGRRASDQALAPVPYPREAPEGPDLSYPGQCLPWAEQFFRIARPTRKWVAYVEADGRGFVQTSTDRLLGRKCFYWGVASAGRRWQEFLGQAGRAYIEIQAGLASSQAFSVPMPPRADWSWTEAFGPLRMDPRAAHDPDYSRAWQAGGRALEGALPRAAVEAMDAELAGVADAAPESILHAGSGWGAVERRRFRVQGTADRIPAGLSFPESSMGADQAPWLELLEKGRFPESDPQADPGAYQVHPEWRGLLESATAAGKAGHWRGWYHLGVMRMEARETDAAALAWIESLRRAPSAWAYRGLAVVAERLGRPGEAVHWLELAWKVNPEPVAYPVAVELAQAYHRAGRHQAALEFFERLPAELRAWDRLRLEEVRARILTHRFEGTDAFFRHEFAVLREGEQSLDELWFQFQERRLSVEERRPIDRALSERVRKEFPPPHEIGFV